MNKFKASYEILVGGLLVAAMCIHYLSLCLFGKAKHGSQLDRQILV